MKRSEAEPGFELFGIVAGDFAKGGDGIARTVRADEGDGAIEMSGGIVGLGLRGAMERCFGFGNSAECETRETELEVALLGLRCEFNVARGRAWRGARLRGQSATAECRPPGMVCGGLRVLP